MVISFCSSLTITFSANGDVLPAKLSAYIAFWLPERLRKASKVAYSLIVALSQFPRSLSALWSNEQFGKPSNELLNLLLSF